MKTKNLLPLLVAALLLLMLPLCAAAEAQQWKVTYYDSDGQTALLEIEVADGETAPDVTLEKSGYTLSGLFVTPALLRPFDPEMPITQDTSLFAAWDSAAVDERPWMIAGSLAGYPENNWGHAWPQDDFLFKKVEGALNTYEYELNLYAGDEFKIAVIDENYGWHDNIGGSALTDSKAMTGGEDAFNSGSNIKVIETGKYRLTLLTDAETLSLCKLSYERIGEADAAEFSFLFQIQGDFNGWGENPEDNLMEQDGDNYAWSAKLSVPKDELWTFGVKNLATGDWYDLRKVDPSAAANFVIAEGDWTVSLEIVIENDVVTVTSFTVEQDA
ncbi:MAG: hypothetical protein FWF69_08540 [Firmicutes bacterium]|nr:hypothetical protein [Bacillota bacterium]